MFRFVSSVQADFAPTQPEAPMLPGGRLRLGRCGCGTPRLFRVRRSAWMRILLSLRLYQCAFCACRVLRRPLPQASLYSMRAYLPRCERR